MTRIKYWLGVVVMALGSSASISAFTTSDADTLFNAYNTAFYVTNGGNSYYKLNTGTGTDAGWWTFAEEIEMAEDAHDSAPSVYRQNVVASLCNGFMAKKGTLWAGNEYNDDITWAVIAFSRAYLITGNNTFREVARNNFEAMFSRGWETNFAGGGLWWRTSDRQGKNACINGPAAIAGCYLYNIFGDVTYLNKAKDCYAWERRILFNTGSGAVSDSIGTNYVYNNWASSYNQGTFIGAANFLYRITGLPQYYQDAILATRYLQNNVCSGGIFPEYGSGDFGGFNGIGVRWAARFAKDQNLWATFGPWLTSNANAAWSVRNTNNLAWQKWKTATPAGTNVLDSWDCSDSIIVLSVANPSPADALQITPSAGFTAVAQRGQLPDGTSVNLILTNGGALAFNWSLANTSAWLNVSATAGTLPAAGASTTVTASLIPSAATNLPAGRYFANLAFTNLTSGVVAVRQFLLVVGAGNAPIALTGFNARLLAPSTATMAGPNATAFDVANNYCFYQAGLGTSTRGLPPDGVFTSQADATTIFQFSPYGNTNALMLGNTYPSSATLTLTTPRVYTTLTVLATSANGGGNGTMTVNFTNGTQSPVFAFNAQDWFATTNNAAINGMGRLKLGGSFAAEDNGTSNPNLYQTTLNLAGLGLTQAVASITFTKPASAGSCAIFAVSGRAAYRAPTIIQSPSPANLVRFVGSSNTWSVSVDAGLPVSYFWQLNGTNIPAATGATYQIASLQTNHSGNYTVVASNAFGAVTSSIAALTVVAAPSYPFGQLVRSDLAVGYWRLDESSGAVARDAIATRNGEYSPKVLLGQPGNKLLDPHSVARFGFLATSNSCVTNLPVDFAFSGNVVFSVEAWVNGGAQTTDAGVVTKGYGSGGEQFNLDCGGGSHGFRFFVRDSNGSARVASSSVTPNNQWRHVVGVCDQANGYVRLFVDGVNVAQTTISTNIGILGSPLPMSIGSRKSGMATQYDNQFIGLIEEVAIYHTALTTNQVRAHYLAATNRAPAFVSDPFSVASASAGQAYAATLTPSASDPNGDSITFTKLSGPAWLSVASNGGLSGTPYSAEAGLNAFAVRVADPGGLFSTATMNLTVVPAPAIVATAVPQGDDLLLSWTGGIAPYQVQTATNLQSPVWENLGSATSSGSVLIPRTNPTAFFQIYGR